MKKPYIIGGITIISFNWWFVFNRYVYSKIEYKKRYFLIIKIKTTKKHTFF